MIIPYQQAYNSKVKKFMKENHVTEIPTVPTEKHKKWLNN
jgi:hypothetical protein